MDFYEALDALTEDKSFSTKRKYVESFIYKFYDIIDPTGVNTKLYKDKFKKMNDKQFDKYMKDFLNDDDQNFNLQSVAFENESHIRSIKKAADYLKMPLDEYVYYKDPSGKTVRTKHKVPVMYLNIKRLQQLLSKKNAYSMSVGIRNQKTGQVTGDDKVARISDAETFGLTTYNAKHALDEFLNARSDDSQKKLQMYKALGTEGYVKLNDLKSDIEDSQSRVLVDVYFTAAGVMTDLVTPGLMLRRTAKKTKEEAKQSNSAKFRNE